MGSQYEKIQGIVTAVVKYSDRHNIVTLYTPSRGRLTFLCSLPASKGSKRRTGRLLPLAVIETEMKPDRNREVQLMRGWSLIRPWPGIYAHPVKTVMAAFITDFLNRLLHDSPPDEALWEKILSLLEEFDACKEGFAGFHLRMLCSLLENMGIEPDISDYAPGRAFDLRAGRYAEFLPMHRDLLRDDDAALPLLMAEAAANIPGWDAKLSSNDAKNHLLDVILRYYAIHVPGVDALKSLPVVRQVFGR